MSTESRLIAVIVSLTLLLITVQLVRRHQLREQHALLWLGASTVILLLSLFGGLVAFISAALGVGYPPTVPLVFGLLFALAILLSQNVAISGMANRIRDLAQNYSILEWQFSQLEAATARSAASDGASSPRLDSEVGSDEAGTAAQPAAARKVLVIGLDGATLDLMRPWAESGLLPGVARLMSDGAHGRLHSTVPPMTAPAWTTCATGTNPGKHGLYDWVARKPGTYRFTPVTAIDCRVPTLFSLLSRAGKRVALLNVPMTYPPLPVNGVVVAGMPAPSLRANVSYPPTFLAKMQDAIGDYVLYPDPGQAYSDRGIDGFLRRLHQSGAARIRALDYIRSLEPWDFCMAVFSGTDTVSHAMWKHMDETHPLHNGHLKPGYGDAILRYYQYLDAYLGRVMADLPPDTTLMVVSDHGFGPFRKFIHVNNWLREQGLLVLKRTPVATLKTLANRIGLAPMPIYDLMMRVGLGALKREVVRGQGRGLLKTLFLSFDDVDWARTRAYSLGNVGQICINLAGREPQGCVQPGDEYEAVRDEIIAGLHTLTDPETGGPVVDTVYRREDIYSGDQLERAADIVFIPRGMEYFGFGEYEFGSNHIIEAVKHGISGTHRLDGVFFAYGAGVKPGTWLPWASITDVAPTVLAIMGETIPEHMDGRVLTEAFVDGSVSDTRTATQAWSPTADAAGDQFTDEEARTLSERLRDLGYIG